MKIVAITRMDMSYLQENIPEKVRSQIDFIWCKNSAEADAFLSDAEAVVTSGRLDPDITEKAPKLRWVQCLSSGVNKLPLRALEERNILVTNAKGVHIVQMSEFAMGLLLQWTGKAHIFHRNQTERKWDTKISTDELHGKTIAIIGTGAIGKAVARKCEAFDMNVIGYNRTGEVPPHFNQIFTGEKGLSALLPISDFVMLLLPSTPKTRHFMTKEHFQQMKQSAFLINLARGDVIDEQELIRTLQEGRIAGAALDVFEQEPLPETSPLWSMENVILTPHIAGASEYYVQRAATIFYHNMEQYLAGKPLMNSVDLQEGY
jgi:phosphoglycerate dehydrogenase-like enzyme